MHKILVAACHTGERPGDGLDGLLLCRKRSLVDDQLGVHLTSVDEIMRQICKRLIARQCTVVGAAASTV